MKKTNEQKLIDTEESMVVTRGTGRWRELEKDEGGQIRGDGRRFNFGL